MKCILTFIITGFFMACNNGSTLENNEKITVQQGIERPVTHEISDYNVDSQIKQKLIKEAYLEFETQNLEKTYADILTLIKTHNGYIQEDNANKYYDRLSRQLTLRVPTKAFQTVMHALDNSVKHFDSKRINSKDVTEEFIDIEARLKAKKKLEQRYVELLSKAKNVKEILEIERELSKIREDIEAKQGRLQYLQNKVSLSTINIVFYKTLATDSGATISYGQKMWNAIKSGFNGLSYFFIGLLNIWPVLVFMVVAVLSIKRWLKKRK